MRGKHRGRGPIAGTSWQGSLGSRLPRRTGAALAPKDHQGAMPPLQGTSGPRGWVSADALGPAETVSGLAWGRGADRQAVGVREREEKPQGAQISSPTREGFRDHQKPTETFPPGPFLLGSREKPRAPSSRWKFSFSFPPRPHEGLLVPSESKQKVTCCSQHRHHWNPENERLVSASFNLLIHTRS